MQAQPNARDFRGGPQSRWDPSRDPQSYDRAWHGLAAVALDCEFEAVVLAGNVMLFLAPGTEAAVVRNLAGHLQPGGLLVSGFQLTAGRLRLDEYDAMVARTGLELAGRWATWDKQMYQGGDYAVCLHRRPARVR
jgi:hypothetical protein